MLKLVLEFPKPLNTYETVYSQNIKTIIKNKAKITTLDEKKFKNFKNNSVLLK